MYLHFKFCRIARTAALSVAIGVGVSLGAQRASAEPRQIDSQMVRVQVDSGRLQNLGADAAVLFSQMVDLGPDVPWVRVLFDKEGTTLSPGSYIRVTSLLDGETQILDAQELERWYYGTAFFNGSAFRLDLIGGPNAKDAQVRIQSVYAGKRVAAGLAATVAIAPEGDVDVTAGSEDGGKGGVAAICGDVDERVPLNKPDRNHYADARGIAVGRLIEGEKVEGKADRGSCTAFLINSPPDILNKLLLSAGHCFLEKEGTRIDQDLTAPFVVEFNVPNSQPDCTMVHPPIADQYVVAGDTVIAEHNFEGKGNDFAVFAVHPNQITGMTAFAAQGVALTLAGAPPDEADVVVMGYGVDGGRRPNDCGSSAIDISFIGPGPNGMIDTPLNNCPGGKANDHIHVDEMGVPYIATGADNVMDTFIPAPPPPGNDDVCIALGAGCACGNYFLGQYNACVPDQPDSPRNVVLQWCRARSSTLPPTPNRTCMISKHPALQLTLSIAVPRGS